jgi:hypothetical protein
MSKIFPIKVEPACLLKWAWSTVFLNSGASSSCHRTQHYQIDPDNFDSFHNLPEKIKAREAMLRGEWPGAGCEYCKNIESVNGLSDRKFQLDQCSQQLVPPELWDNPAETSVTPTILEVYFTNTCNMACVYCGPYHSSKWEDENRRFGSLFPDVKEKFSVQVEQNNPQYEKMVKSLWEYLKTNNRVQFIQRYHILGGEPFLLKELDQSIDFWGQYGHPDLEISIVSNLNIPHNRFVNYIKKFEILAKNNKMWRLQLTASLDCWGSEQEYVRYGLDLSLWEKNFTYILNTPWILPSINSAISSLTIHNLPTLIKKINEWNLGQEDVIKPFRTYPNKILHSFNTTRQIDDPYIFSGNVFADYFEKTLQAMPESTEIQRGQKEMMQGIADQSKNCTSDIEKINQLKNYLSDLDLRRGTNWKQTFPWLAEV